MTADELVLREAQPKDTHMQIRCAPDEKRDWMKRAGSKRQLSEWARKVLNRECIDPRLPITERTPDEPSDLPEEPVVVYDP
jgi:hypothetical protein